MKNEIIPQNYSERKIFSIGHSRLVYLNTVRLLSCTKTKLAHALPDMSTIVNVYKYRKNTIIIWQNIF